MVQIVLKMQLEKLISFLVILLTTRILTRNDLMATEAMLNIFDFSREQLRSWMRNGGYPIFHADQIIHWIHQKGIINWSDMSNLSKKMRNLMANNFVCDQPRLESMHQSSDGTIKFVVRLNDNNAVETVYIPDKTRATLCVSSQVGCALNCSFCSTGKEGFNRNLTAGEIISQLWLVRSYLHEFQTQAQAVTNVVLMGMGEPLLNYKPVISALSLMLDDMAYGLSKYRVTLSTSGVIPAMSQLKKDSPVALAVSLHAPNDKLRETLVPLNKKYPLKILMNACRDYFANEKKRQVTFEYVMLDGINDQIAHAKELVHLVANVPCKINLIPFNCFPGTSYIPSTDSVISRFQDYLINAGLNTRVRRRRGDDVDAACGQLVGRVNDRTGRHDRWLRSGRLVPDVSNER